MSLLVRVLLVVGALTYLAARQADGRPSSISESVGADLRSGASIAQRELAETVAGTLAPVGADIGGPSTASTVLEQARRVTLDRLVREVADGRILRASDRSASQDTLSDADRRPAWRGTPGR